VVAVSAAPDGASPNRHRTDAIGDWSPPGVEVLVNVAVPVPGVTAVEKAAVGGEGGGDATPEYRAASWLGPMGQIVRSVRRRFVYVALTALANAVL
jgi:hypothetical protein